jgi:hypothetical protein
LILNAFDFCLEKRHAQHIHTWRDNERKRIHKQMSYSYVYGSSPKQRHSSALSSDETQKASAILPRRFPSIELNDNQQNITN